MRRHPGEAPCLTLDGRENSTPDPGLESTADLCGSTLFGTWPPRPAPTSFLRGRPDFSIIYIRHSNFRSQAFFLLLLQAADIVDRCVF